MQWHRSPNNRAPASLIFTIHTLLTALTRLTVDGPLESRPNQIWLNPSDTREGAESSPSDSAYASLSRGD